MTMPDETADSAVKPDMTPMIDVVFLMIIFFLCIEFRTLEAKLPAYLPKDRGGSPTSAPPQEQLGVRVLCAAEGVRRYAPGDREQRGRYRLEGHAVRWQVGPVEVDSLDRLQRELARVAAAPSSLIPDAGTGGRRLLPCVIEPEAGVRYADVAATADAAHASGFVEITFAGGAGARPR